jgi:4-diphosphocytidyl-2-C-methyl-D-erythritol kinase
VAKAGIVIHTVAPAKINWTLEVLGKRDDGYHEVRTVLQTIELHDELSFEAAEDFDYEVKGPYQPTQDDTVLRAASLFAVEHEVGGVHIRLDKRVPVASGLGGGSSDAAATLRAMIRLSGAGLSDDQLAAFAGAIGSDVAFFVRGGTALGEGRGEQIRPLPDAREAWLVLVVPAIAMENKTRTMYGALTPGDFWDGSRTAALAARIESGEPIEDSMLCNAFERAAYEKFDGLAGFRDWMLEAGARSVHLSGAGPALFALASGEPEARAIRGRMNRARRGERVYVVRTIPASEATLLWTT